MSAVLFGVKSIAKHLSGGGAPLSPRQVHYMIQQGRLPTFRMGAIICSTPDLIDEHFRELRRKSVDDSG